MAYRSDSLHGNRLVARKRGGEMLTEKIMDGLVEVSLACETISRAEKCKACPCKEYCLYDVDFTDFVAQLTMNDLRRFITMGEIITEQQEEASKSEEQRRWEAEADRWNDRRCDPSE